MPAETAPAFRRLDDAVERLYDLNVGVIGTGANRHERPHKPLLLLAILDLIANGSVTPARVERSNALRARFGEYFSKVGTGDDNNTPENPFLRLRTDGLWEPMELASDALRPLERTPTAGDAASERVFGRFINGFERCVQSPSDRLQLREAIVSRYFPAHRTTLTALYAEGGNLKPEPEFSARVREESEERPGRKHAFRRKVREIYDSQCVACGLRIRLPDTSLTFVDGAHLIPFSVSQNDHPTNGIALCKNHHWAMDSDLIVLTPDRRWRASSRLDERRSPGEEELQRLNGRTMLPPHDEAFWPDPEALRWRFENFCRKEAC